MTRVFALRDLVVGYRQPILGPITLTFQPGIYALLGRNGAGKTTFLRTLAGILPPLSGTVISPEGSQIGYLGHRAALSEGLSVDQNLKFWHQITALYTQPRSLQTVINEFELSGILSKRVRQLSRGQRQRVDLARLSLCPAELLLLDEPLTGLDPVQAQRVRRQIQSWAQSCPLIFSAHSLPEVLEVANRFLVVQGREVKLFTREDLAQPEADLLRALEAL